MSTIYSLHPVYTSPQFTYPQDAAAAHIASVAPSSDSSNQLRRHLHNQAEQRRRDRINDVLQELKELLPEEFSEGNKGKTIRKASILTNTIKYIKFLMEKEKGMEKQIEDLKAEIGHLKSTCHASHSADSSPLNNLPSEYESPSPESSNGFSDTSPDVSPQAFLPDVGLNFLSNYGYGDLSFSSPNVSDDTSSEEAQSESYLTNAVDNSLLNEHDFAPASAAGISDEPAVITFAPPVSASLAETQPQLLGTTYQELVNPSDSSPIHFVPSHDQNHHNNDMLVAHDLVLPAANTVNPHDTNSLIHSLHNDVTHITAHGDGDSAGVEPGREYQEVLMSNGRRKRRLISDVSRAVVFSIVFMSLFFNHRTKPVQDQISDAANRVLQQSPSSIQMHTTTFYTCLKWFYSASRFLLNKTLTAILFLLFGYVTVVSRETLFSKRSKEVQTARSEQRKGNRALARNDYVSAKGHFENVLILLERPPPDGRLLFFCHFIWVTSRQILHRLKVGIWLDRIYVSLFEGRACYLEAAAAYHGLFRISMNTNLENIPSAHDKKFKNDESESDNEGPETGPNALAINRTKLMKSLEWMCKHTPIVKRVTLPATLRSSHLFDSRMKRWFFALRALNLAESIGPNEELAEIYASVSLYLELYRSVLSLLSNFFVSQAMKSAMGSGRSGLETPPDFSASSPRPGGAAAAKMMIKGGGSGSKYRGGKSKNAEKTKAGSKKTTAVVLDNTLVWLYFLSGRKSLNAGDWNSALASLKKSAVLFQEQKRYSRMFYALEEFGLIFYARGSIMEAEQLFKNMLNCALELHRDEDACRSLLLIASCVAATLNRNRNRLVHQKKPHSSSTAAAATVTEDEDEDLEVFDLLDENSDVSSSSAVSSVSPQKISRVISSSSLNSKFRTRRRSVSDTSFTSAVSSEDGANVETSVVVNNLEELQFLLNEAECLLSKGNSKNSDFARQLDSLLCNSCRAVYALHSGAFSACVDYVSSCEEILTKAPTFMTVLMVHINLCEVSLCLWNDIESSLSGDGSVPESKLSRNRSSLENAHLKNLELKIISIVAKHINRFKDFEKRSPVAKPYYLYYRSLFELMVMQLIESGRTSEDSESFTIPAPLSTFQVLTSVSRTIRLSTANMKRCYARAQSLKIPFVCRRSAKVLEVMFVDSSTSVVQTRNENFLLKEDWARFLSHHKMLES